MKLSELFESHSGVPVSADALADELPLWDFVQAVRTMSASTKPKSITIDVRHLADSGKLFGTQGSTAGDDAVDEPVFPGLTLPVIYEENGVGYIIDGHHRLDKAYEGHKSVEVFWFK